MTPVSFGAGVSVCEGDEVCKLAIELDPELAVLWYEPDLFDDLPEALGGRLCRQMTHTGQGRPFYSCIIWL